MTTPMGEARLDAFCDGMIAIIITPIVLEPASRSLIAAVDA